MIEIKPGVRLHGIRPEVVLAVQVAEGIWMEAGTKTLIITSGIEGKHTALTSAHYDGRAVDLRTKTLAAGQAEPVTALLKQALGPDFFILLEFKGEDREHAHMEFRPSGAYNL